MKKFTKLFKLCLISLSLSFTAIAQLQNPAAVRDDVWFQTFGWDSYNRPFVTAEGNFYSYINNRTTSLAASGFDAIWLPPPSASSGGMGYIPTQWFNFSSTTFGTQANLSALLNNIRTSGMHPIADMVVNHRSDGTSGGFNFTNPSLGGCTAIATNPNGGSQPGACGNNDTEGCDGTGYGYGWFGMELDHTNTVVQTQIKQFLTNLKTLGFEGWRWDFVKGFNGRYVGEYLMSTPYYASVGEFWDGNISKTQCWINQTGNTVSGTNPDKSMAFDFPLYYNLSTALTNSNYSLINSPAAAGLYGQFGYSDKAVTFIENHDSFKDNKFVGDNIMKAYAYILTHPGIPCVSAMHYYGGTWSKDGVTVNYGSGYQQKINELVAVRKANGINAWSSVVVSNSGSFYSAIIDGKVAVKIGSGSWNPGGGYNLITSGNDYAVWSIAQVNPAPTVTISPVSSTVTAPVTVTITATDNGTTNIYYTTDGSTPTAGSTPYLGTFNVTSTTTVKAIAIDNGGLSSGVVSATYTFVTPTNFKVYLNTTGCPLWTTPRLHLWGEIPAGAIPSLPWPGRLMTNEGPNLWSYSFTGIYSTNIVFNSGQSPTPSQQTRPDILGVTQETTYTLGANCESFTVSTPCPTPAPTGPTPVPYCQGATATPLTATGTALLWYTTATGGTGSTSAPTPSTATVGSTIYYVSQTLTGCEGPRLAITVNVTATPAAPGVTTPVTYCQGATANPLTATGTNLLWYTTSTGGTGSATAPTPSTTTVGSTTYYVSQSVSGCESPRASIVVTVNAIPAAPGVTTPVTYCQGATAVPLTATGTNLLWYTTVTGGTGNATAPTPSTTTVGSTTYYVSQTVNGCESPRASIVVTVNAIPAAPGVTSPVTYCQGATAVPLIATGTNLLWYTTATGGTGSTTAPTPATGSAGTTLYYVSQSNSCGESSRASISVIVNPTPAAPAVSTPVTYCQGATAVPLTATGTNLLWYTTATGGTGSTTAPTPSTSTVGSNTYYVSQTVSGCESPRVSIVVTISSTPAAPGVSTPVVYCQGTTAVPLTATGTNLLWYTTATGGTGNATAPTPSTANAGSTIFYVSQATVSCEGPRASITVTVTQLPALPVVTTPVAYCINVPASALTATGTNLMWYTTATGGTGSAIAPTPATATVGSTAYYVTQTVNGCVSPRAPIVVDVTAGPAAPTNLSVSSITLTSAVLNWNGQASSYYRVQYKAASSTSWITLANGITATTVSLSGLILGTTYDWRVSANCDVAGSSTVFSSSQFSTTFRNTNVTNIRNGIGLKLTPNPLRSSAILDYTVPQAGSFTIAIYDARGSRVISIAGSATTAGANTLDINKGLVQLAQGIYTLRLEQNGKSNSIKFFKEQ